MSLIRFSFLLPNFDNVNPSKTKHLKLAQKHREEILAWLGEKDQSLVHHARNNTPVEHYEAKGKKETKKRKRDASLDSTRTKKKATGKKTMGEMTQGEREEHGMNSLLEFIKEKGGSIQAVEKFRCTVTKKPSDGRYDTNYYNEQGRRFRSMVEVGRHLNLVAQSPRSAAAMKRAGMKKRKETSREIEAEKRKLRKELEKLRKQHTKATKALDDFLTNEKDSRYPIEDMLLQEEEEETSSKTRKILPTNCTAARIPDIDKFPGIPKHCIPDTLVAWDFLCTFTKSIAVNPISLEDFIQCLTYEPPPRLTDSDMLKSPPVYLGEVHLGLMKLLLSDKSSDDWWWSILETDQTENAVADLGDVVEKEESDLPLIKVDFAALLCETEDPLITTSWLQSLEVVRKVKTSDSVAIKESIKTAMGVVANKWVLAYLRKALKLGRTSGTPYMARAIIWLLDRVRNARPDLGSRSVSNEAVFKQRAKVAEEVSQQMEKLSSAVLAVNDDDLVSDVEDSDDDSDDSDDEEEKESTKETLVPPSLLDPNDRPASYIPKKPAPTLVDLLLPPGKPIPPDDLLSPAAWPHMAGAAVCRIIHRYRRLRNEADDSLRQVKDLPRVTVKERRAREAIATGRVFSEFAVKDGETDPSQHAFEHLCAGGNYLDLSPLERLCILRVLIDAAYDTLRLHEIVDSNHKQRTNAAKALEQEKKRSRREAKDKATADEQAAREDLALEAKRNFIEEKREEIRKANEANHELTDEDIDTLTDLDIIEFDDDIKADYDALPTPESYKKVEVVQRVAKIQEADAFETELLTVLTWEELLEKEKATKSAMEVQLQELGGEDALLDPYLDRSIARAIEKLRRELARMELHAESLTSQREAAIDNLKDAIADGTVKSLRGAIRSAKTAKLFGPDPDTNGVWALDVVRDAHMELENAKQLKRVADAQKDLVSKLNKCFIRTKPLGSDRFRNRFWRFQNTEDCHVWTEVGYTLKEPNSNMCNEPGFLDLVSEVSGVTMGSPDIEGDFGPRQDPEIEKFRLFGRKEYHQSGLTASLAKRYWGCHLNETSVLPLMKGLDGRGMRENKLKTRLKEVLELEEKGTTNESGTDETKAASGDVEGNKSGADEEEESDDSNKVYTGGDESVFEDAKRQVEESQSDAFRMDLVEHFTSGIGQNVRIRTVVEVNKDREVARYENGSISSWKIRKEDVAIEADGDEFEPQTKVVETPVWCAVSERGQESWLTGIEVMESICRYSRWKEKETTYFEPDAAFIAYRNALGRHCGRAADAAHTMTPIHFTQTMVRSEAQLYQRLKPLVYDNSWGGKNGSRNAWVTSMRDYAFDFETAREGLLTLENAFLELTGGLPAETSDVPERSGRQILDDPLTREDIELESIENAVVGLWNDRASRAVFLEIVKCKLTLCCAMLGMIQCCSWFSFCCFVADTAFATTACKTVGFLALAFGLVCRNTNAYIDANKIKGGAQDAPSGGGGYYDSGSSRSRRTNSWQQQGLEEMPYYQEYLARPTRRAARVNYMGLD